MVESRKSEMHQTSWGDQLELSLRPLQVWHDDRTGTQRKAGVPLSAGSRRRKEDPGQHRHLQRLNVEQGSRVLAGV